MLMIGRTCSSLRSGRGVVSVRPLFRDLCGGAKSKGVDTVTKTSVQKGLTEAAKGTSSGVKVWGSNVELPSVTKKEAEESYLNATSVSRAVTPPTGLANEARNDMTKHRIDYVSTNLRPASQYVVMGKTGAVAPVAVSQGALGLASMIVLVGGIIGAVYIKKEWKLESGKDLGDRLREKGAARRETLESSSATMLIRTISQTADKTVKSNVDLIRRPTQHLGSHLNDSFQGKVVKAHKGKTPESGQLPPSAQPAPLAPTRESKVA